MKNTDTNRFEPGTIVYHRATDERCVVIKVEEGLVVVRTEHNVEDRYYPQELDTETDREAESERKRQQIPPGPFDNSDPYGI